MIELLSALAIWRISNLLVDEDGPFKIFYRLRRLTKATDLLTCIYCISIWVSIPFAFYLADGWDIVIYTFALSAGSLLLNKLMEDKS